MKGGRSGRGVMNLSDGKPNRWLIALAVGGLGVVLLGLVLWGRYGTLETVGLPVQPWKIRAA